VGIDAAGGQDRGNLARKFDVVVVKTNNRLGLLGFLYLDHLEGLDYAGSGNMALLDITARLKWVKENIAVFGGDPNNVMIFNESGGGAKTSCLYTTSEAAPYFNKSSIESGPGVRILPEEAAIETTAMAKYLKRATLAIHPMPESNKRKFFYRYEFAKVGYQNCSNRREHLPVMEYSMEAYHSSTHRSGHTTILSAEIARHLQLDQLPKNYELVDFNNQKAVINVDYYEQDPNSLRLIFLRKELLNKYLSILTQIDMDNTGGERERKISSDGVDFTGPTENSR
jgi:hypothetical protein